MKATKIIATALTSAFLLGSLCSCVSIGNMYDNADKYSAGNTEISGDVENLCIDWQSGSVTVSYYDKDTVSITETCDTELSEERQVHTWLDGKTLRIHYCKSGENFTLTNSEKKLEVKLPKNTELKSLSYDGSSAGSHFDSIYAENFSVDTSSGAAQLDNCSADIFDIDASSGNIYFTQTGVSSKINVDTSSGSLSLTADTVAELNTDSSSGKMELDIASADRITTECSSGDVELRLGAMPSETIMDASSGDITLWIPKDAGFTAEVDTASGSFDSEVAFTKKGDTYVFGSGDSKLDIDTSSGDVTIKAAE